MQFWDAERFLLNKNEFKRSIRAFKYAVVARELSGVTVYFPENYVWQDKKDRNARLKEDFYSGQYEISDLAKKYGLSISRVYKIVQNKV